MFDIRQEGSEGVFLGKEEAIAIKETSIGPALENILGGCLEPGNDFIFQLERGEERGEIRARGEWDRAGTQQRRKLAGVVLHKGEAPETTSVQLTRVILLAFWEIVGQVKGMCDAL